MNYLGGKGKIADKIVSLFPNSYNGFYEPFCGGLNITQKINGRVFANDINKSLITLYTAVQNGYNLPETITKDAYNFYKEEQNEDDPLTAFIGIGCSFGAKWFGGYAKNSKGDNYALRAKNSLLKKMYNCKDTIFSNLPYQEFLLTIPNGALVYFDPPYKNTTEYKNRGFNHEEFYTLVRELAKRATIFVSEYYMPNDFKCLLEIPVTSSLEKKSSNNNKMERVFSI